MSSSEESSTRDMSLLGTDSSSDSLESPVEMRKKDDVISEAPISTKNQKREKRLCVCGPYVIVGLVCMFGIIVILICVALIGLVFMSKKRIDAGEVYTYRYSHFDLRKNETTHGIANLPHDLGDEEFVTTFLENGNVKMLSAIGTEEVMCTGNCFCEDSVEERKSYGAVAGRSLSNSIKFLVAVAFGVGIDWKVKQTLQEHCVEEYEGETCIVISAEIDECEPVKFVLNKDGKENFRDKQVEGVYRCHGRCLPKELYDVNRDCEEHELTYNFRTTTHFFEADKGLYDAEMNFLLLFLEDFCKEKTEQCTAGNDLGENRSVKCVHI